MEEDEELYHQLACWRNNNNYEKTEAVEEAEAKIAELKATIESLTAKSAELKAEIEELEKEVAENKAALEEATAIREKEAKLFHATELDDIQGLENLKAAIMVLQRHHAAAFPQLSLSLISVGTQDTPYEKILENNFDTFMEKNGWTGDSSNDNVANGFLQHTNQQPVVTKEVGASSASSWSAHEVAVVRKALKSANAFMQEKHGEGYYPAYAAQSGEILGIMKQLEEEMGGDLIEAQKEEAKKVAAFEEFRKAKTEEIESGEKMAEQKEDELAETDNALAEAKEDIGQVEDQLSEDEKFLMNLEKTCKDAGANFEERKKSRLEEIKAVSETIQILTADEARDTFKATFSFVQVSTRKVSEERRKAAALLRKVASQGHPEMALMATTVELDAFTKVKKAIDDMIAMLKTQQEDEVKKHDWCKAELQETEMTTMKTEDLKADLEAKIGKLDTKIETLTKEIADAQAAIGKLQVELQRASEDRQKENHDFQNTIAEQRMTIKVLKMALERMAKFYDSEDLLQVDKKGAKRQTPPVPQMEYSKNAGASGVMSMMEKLIYDAKDLEKESLKGEQEAQAAYETLIADTNGSIAALTAEIVTKTKENAQAKKDKDATESDLIDTVDELERLSKYTADLHAECDYLLKNFGIRQEARAQEIEALQQAKQILSGANLS